MLYYITTVVNRHEEFRTDLDKNGEPGIYSEMFPSYTVFHKDTETFSELWTEYSSDYDTFCSRYEHDMAQYGDRKGLLGKPGMPENVFPVSMISWTSFEGFNLNLQKGYDYLLPVFTILRWESFTRKTDADFFPCLFRFTMPFVTVSIFASFLGSYRN